MKRMTLQNTELTMSSWEIAQITGKRHDHVMRDIRNLEPYYLQVYGNELKFALVDCIDEKGDLRPEYQITKSQTLCLVLGYDMILRAKVQLRWDDLEQALITPSRTELAQMVIVRENMLEALSEEKRTTGK
ncbi:Rha family transcriptional regulator [Bacteroidota bacterium]